jgi:ATP-binding protein involved in chromosome partitioning
LEERMSIEEQVKEVLRDVLVPGVMRGLVGLNLVRSIEVQDDKVKVSIASAALDPNAQAFLTTKVRDVVGELSGVNEVAVDFVEAKPQEVNQIGHVVTVMSGKGGVGKSAVSALVALALSRSGKEVGILDADITGPSIPKMFGLSGHPMGSENGILPALSKAAIEIMSINLLLPNEDDAVIWRGPLIGNAVKQFWEEVLWGKLDYLVVDLPPGTADVPLTVMQTVPVTGVIIVSSPQELAGMVVRKAMQMTEKMNVPILGVVENMSYLVLPDSGKQIEVFGPSRADEMAKAAGAPLLGQIPLDPELARLCDEGAIERYSSDAFDEFAETVVRVLTGGQ